MLAWRCSAPGWQVRSGVAGAGASRRQHAPASTVRSRRNAAGQAVFCRPVWAPLNAYQSSPYVGGTSGTFCGLSWKLFPLLSFLQDISWASTAPVPDGWPLLRSPACVASVN